MTSSAAFLNQFSRLPEQSVSLWPQSLKVCQTDQFAEHEVEGKPLGETLVLDATKLKDNLYRFLTAACICIAKS